MATESACHKIHDLGKTTELFSTVIGILRSAKLPKRIAINSKRHNPLQFHHYTKMEPQKHMKERFN